MGKQNHPRGGFLPVLERQHVGHVIDIARLCPAVGEVLELNLIGVLRCFVLNEGFGFRVPNGARNARTELALLLQIGVSSFAAKRLDRSYRVLTVRDAQEPEANQRGEESVTRFPRRTSSKVCGNVLVILLLSHILK